jgi:hypothetical protein
MHRKTFEIISGEKDVRHVETSKEIAHAIS